MTEIFAELPSSSESHGRTRGPTRIGRDRSCTPFSKVRHSTVTAISMLSTFPTVASFASRRRVSSRLVAEYDGEPNGLKIHNDGRIFIADYNNGILLLDPKSGKLTPIISRRWSERFKGPNDLFFAANDDMYFTDQGQTGLQDPTGRLYRYDLSTDKLDLLLGTIPSPNGLVMNVEENAIFVAVTRGNCVWRMPILGDGSVTKVGLFVQLSGGLGGPDGLAMDEAGNLAVAHAGLGSVWVFDRLGQPIHRVRSCSRTLDHEHRLWRGRPQDDVHHRIRIRRDSACDHAGGGQDDAFASNLNRAHAPASARRRLFS